MTGASMILKDLARTNPEKITLGKEGNALTKGFY
jgi:hypothetical protein